MRRRTRAAVFAGLALACCGVCVACTYAWDLPSASTPDGSDPLGFCKTHIVSPNIFCDNFDNRDRDGDVQGLWTTFTVIGDGGAALSAEDGGTFLHTFTKGNAKAFLRYTSTRGSTATTFDFRWKMRLHSATSDPTLFANVGVLGLPGPGFNYRSLVAAQKASDTVFSTGYEYNDSGPASTPIVRQAMLNAEQWYDLSLAFDLNAQTATLTIDQQVVSARSADLMIFQMARSSIYVDIGIEISVADPATNLDVDYDDVTFAFQ